MNHKIFTVGIITCALLLAALITHSGELALMTMPFLFYLGMGFLTLPAADRTHLAARREVSRTQFEDWTEIAMEIALQNNGQETVFAHIYDPLQTGMKFTNGEREQFLCLEPGEKATTTYTFQAMRGSFAWKNLNTVVSDALGLVETRYMLPAEGDMQVKPRMRRFKPIQMHPNSTLHSPGSIPAKLGGSGTDFWGVREYHPGDPLRRLDWRQTARHPYQFFTKEFEQEEIAEIGLILDGRHKVDLHVGSDSLFEHCLEATASLAEMFLHQGHRLSLLVYGGTMLQAFPGYGKIQLHRIMDCLARVRIGSDNRLLDNLEYLPIRMFPSHALIILISPLSSSDWSLFPRLRAQGYQVLLICPDAIGFGEPSWAQDEHTHMAIRAARIEHQLKLRAIAQLQVSVIDWQVEKPLAPLLRAVLSRPRGRQG